MSIKILTHFSKIKSFVTENLLFLIEILKFCKDSVGRLPPSYAQAPAKERMLLSNSNESGKEVG